MLSPNEKELVKAWKNVEQQKRKEKTYKSAFYSINSILGNQWATYYVLIGGAQTGKSYSIMDYCLKQKKKKGAKLKWYWLRLTDTQQKNLLMNGANRIIDPDLKRKYGYNNLTTKGDTVYTYDPVEHTTKSGKTVIEKTNLQELMITAAASTMANNKGVGFFDNEFEKNGGEYILVLDEMNREATEKNSFDICRSVARMIENLVRDTHAHIRFFMIGNDIGEASDLLTAFNFIPDDYGRYKLKRQLAVIDYIRPNEQYKEMRKKSIANKLSKEIGAVDGAGYEVDASILVNKRLRTKPVAIIKFGKTKDMWYTLWNDNIISTYNGEKKNTIAMNRYLDEVYNQEYVKTIVEMFDARMYRFTTLAAFKKFQSSLKLLKGVK